MDKKCIVCRGKYDSQFVSKYETTDSHEKDIISVCEFCFEEHSQFDEEKNLPYISVGNGEYYPSSQI